MCFRYCFCPNWNFYHQLATQVLKEQIQKSFIEKIIFVAVL